MPGWLIALILCGTLAVLIIREGKRVNKEIEEEDEAGKAVEWTKNYLAGVEDNGGRER
jgi:hypothetical protein